MHCWSTAGAQPDATKVVRLGSDCVIRSLPVLWESTILYDTPTMHVPDLNDDANDGRNTKACYQAVQLHRPAYKPLLQDSPNILCLRIYSTYDRRANGTARYRHQGNFPRCRVPGSSWIGSIPSGTSGTCGIPFALHGQVPCF